MILLLRPYYFPSIICVHPRVLAHKLVVVFVSPVVFLVVTLATDLLSCVGSLVLFGLTMLTTWHARGLSADDLISRRVVSADRCRRCRICITHIAYDGHSLRSRLGASNTTVTSPILEG